MKIPEGCEFGMRTVHPDFTSSRGFRWPFPGRWAKASGPFTKSDDPCPSYPGDGLCVGLSWRGMASGGIPAAAVLLVAFREADVLARKVDKLRARRVFVVDVVTPGALLAERQADESADLTGANLTGWVRGPDGYARRTT